MNKKPLFLSLLISAFLFTSCKVGIVIDNVTSSSNTSSASSSSENSNSSESQNIDSNSSENSNSSESQNIDSNSSVNSNSSESSTSSSDTSSTSSVVEGPTSDPYENVTSEEFYSDYKEATSYEDAQYRTKHGFISGTLEHCFEIDHNPLTNGVKENSHYVRVTDANYEYFSNGDFKSYNMNYIDGTSKKIFYNAGYVNMDEVATYLLAFGEVPPNNHYSKSNGGKNSSVKKWGEHGRVNYGNFRGEGRYDEPAMPDNSYQRFIETDFGAHRFSTAAIYNDGHSISRGICRFVFTSFASEPNINKRRVFFTYNHYNDFQEYLNYYGGWGERFGYESGNYTTTQYPSVVKKSLNEINL